MNILITGGTGFIGSALSQSLSAHGHQVCVLSRYPEQVAKCCGNGIQALAHLDNIQSGEHYDVIVNLAGAPIFDVRWSEARKKILLNSRVELTDRLIDKLACLSIRPKLLISGSAIGYYGNQSDTVLTEQSAAHDDFSHRLCIAWENSALQAESLGIRVCLIRTGLVLASGGGLLQRMLLPFRLGLGDRIGDGRQWMSWIHRQDWIAIALAMISDEHMRGVYNATAPKPVTNDEFSQTLAACLNRPAALPIPAWALKLALGEMSELVLGSQRVLPQRLLDQGFEFNYPDLESALKQALHRLPI